MAITKEKWSVQSIVLLGVLMCLGFLGNYCSVLLFFDVSFIFGSIAVMLILYFYGLMWGIIATVITTSYTYLLWNHPYAIIIFTFEALFVGIFIHRKSSNIILLDSIYWILFGMPLVLLFYYGVMKIPINGSCLIMLKQAMNGIHNVVVASIIINIIIVSRKYINISSSFKNISLQQTLFNIIMSFILFPAIVLLIIDSHNEIKKIEKDSRNNILNVASITQEMISSWLKHHFVMIKELSLIVVNHNTINVLQMQNILDQFKIEESDFLRLGVCNSQGVSVAFTPSVDDTGKSTIGIDLAGRDWYKALHDSHQPVLSDAFQGHIGKSKPIAVIGIPILKGHDFIGCVVGTLSLAKIGDFLSSLTKQSNLYTTLIDSQRQIVVSTNKNRQPLEKLAIPMNGESSAQGDGIFLWVPKLKKFESVMERWRNSIYLKEVSIPGSNWQLLIEIPVAPYNMLLQQENIKRLSLFMVIILCIILFSNFISKKLLNSLSKLQVITNKLPEQIATHKIIEWPHSSMQEVSDLVDNFQHMADSLDRQFQQMQSFNAVLEERIEARTNELSKTNDELRQEISERLLAEKSLRQSEERYRLIFENAPLGIVHFDVTGIVTECNAQLLDIMGAPREKIIGLNLLHTLVDAKMIEAVTTAIRGETGYYEGDYLSVAGGKLTSLQAFYRRVLSPEGNFICAIGIFEDITSRRLAETERKKSEAKIHASLAEKEVLLREIHHRVKNNLQIVVGILNIQSRFIKDPLVKEMLQDCQTRIRSMALVHEVLYRSENLSEISLHEYLTTLVNELVRSYRKDGQVLRVKTDIAKITIKIETAIPCGLIMTELVSNALKHAFCGNRDGELYIAVGSLSDGEIELVVRDNGVGIPVDVDLTKSDTLGLRLITDLAEHQLKGKIILNREHGTEFKINFKEPHYKKRI